MAQALAQAPAQQTPASPADPIDQLEQNFDRGQQAKQTLGVAREGMDGLLALGENVTMKDLVKVGAKLVAEGLDPTAIASLLADAPQGNSLLLAEWIQQQDIELHQREAQLKFVNRSLGYQLGVAGMKMVARGASAAAGSLGGAEPSAVPTGSLPAAPLVAPNALGGSNA